MFKKLICMSILGLLIGSSDATFKKRKGNKGEDATAQGTQNTGKQVGHGQRGPYGSHPGENGYASNHPYDYRRDPDDDDYPPPRGGGGHRPYDRYHGEPSHDDYRRGPPPPPQRYNDDDYRQSSPPHHRPNNRPGSDYDGFHGEPSNHGPYYNKHGSESYDGYHRHHNKRPPGPPHPESHGGGAGGLYGSGTNHSPAYEPNAPGGEHEHERYRNKFYEDSEEEIEQGSNAPKPDGQGEWIGVPSTSSSGPYRGLSSLNGTLNGSRDKLSSLFSRTRTGIKKLLQLP